MNKRERTRYQKIVEAELRRVRQGLGAIEEEINETASKKAAGSQAYSNHMADIGSDAMGQEQAFQHVEQGTDYLKALEDALKRIELGMYGVCEICNDKIPVKRLEAFPAARLCIGCKAEQEKLRRS